MDHSEDEIIQIQLLIIRPIIICTGEQPMASKHLTRSHKNIMQCHISKTRHTQSLSEHPHLLKPVEMPFDKQSSNEIPNKKQLPSTSPEQSSIKPTTLDSKLVATPDGPAEDNSSSSVSKLDVLSKSVKRSQSYMLESPSKTKKMRKKKSLLQCLDGKGERSGGSSFPLLQFVQENKTNYKPHKNSILKIQSVPFRKCQSHIEARVVGIINKLKNGKDCVKQISNLAEKIKKVNRRDLVNRYFVSGVRVLLSLMKERYQTVCLQSSRSQESLKLIDRLAQSYQSLMGRIENYYENTCQYQIVMKEQPSIRDENKTKQKMIRKAYKILKNQSSKDKERDDLMQESIHRVENFFSRGESCLEGFFLSLTDFV